VLSYEDNVLTDLLEERTGVSIEFTLIPQQDYRDRMNLMFAAGAELPDMLNLANTDVNGQLLWGQQGGLIPLNALIEEHGYYFKQVAEQVPSINQLATAADGNLYSFPFVSDCPHCDPSHRFWINKVWLDNLGLDMPTTTEEFREVLVAFRDQDPNGNGEADEIPLMGARTGWQMGPATFLLNSFTNWDPIAKVHVEDDQLVPTLVSEGYRDGLRYMNQLVEEGLLDPVSFTQNQGQLRTLLQTEPTVIGVFPAGGAFFESYDAVSGDFVHLDPLEGPDGVRWAAYNPWTGIGQGAGAITTEAQYPEVAVRWLDQFFDPDLSIRARFGVEGEHWRRTEPGEVALNSARVEVPAMMLENVWAVEQPHSLHWFLRHPYFLRPSIETADWEAFDPIAKMGDSSMQLLEYVPPEDTQLPPLAFTAEEVEEHQNLRSTIDTYANEARVRFIVGDLDIESDWDSYVSEIESAGLDRWIEIQQQAYNRVWR
jgi:putative aldouronate transport system substrate-binding protein